MTLLDQAHHTVAMAATTFVRLTSEGPKAKDVTAGWVAFAVFLALLGAVALLGWSLRTQLRRVESARRAGVYGEVEEDPRAPVAEPSTQD